MTHRGPFQPRPFCDSVMTYDVLPNVVSPPVPQKKKILHPHVLSDRSHPIHNDMAR